MKSQFLGIEISMPWYDESIVELRVAASNGVFAGQVKFYAGYGELKALAERIAGFPARIGDERIFKIAEAVEMRFRCIDAPGHAVVEVSLRDEPRATTTPSTRMPAASQSVFLAVAIEAAAIDDFVRELALVERKREGAARLRAAGI